MNDFQFSLLLGGFFALLFITFMFTLEIVKGKHPRWMRLLSYILIPIALIAFSLNLYLVKNVPSPTDPTYFEINMAMVEKYLAGQPIDYQDFQWAMTGPSGCLIDIAKKLKMDPTDLIRIIGNESKIIRVQPKRPEASAK